MWLVLANPASGNGRVGKSLHLIESYLHQYNIPFLLKTSTYEREITEIVKNTLNTEGGYRKILGIGGDGTMNEIVNGIFWQHTVPVNDIVFTILPIGTGNDWATTHGISPQLDAFCMMLKKGKTILQDIGVIQFYKNSKPHKHFFANAGGLAYDALVVKSIESQKKYIFGKKIAYFLHILKCLWTYQPEKARLVFNNTTIEDYFYTINLGINKTSGGGLQMTPHAINNDGLMALTLIRNLPKWRVLLYTTKLHNGTIGEVLRYVSLHQAKNIDIESLNQPIFIETDGELIGHTPLSIHILEKALKVLVP